MQILLKFLSSKSRKSFILQIERKKYVFNLFEGFQRYCIEKKESIASFDYIFMTSKYNIPPFIGMYLTLGELYKSEIGIVSSFDSNFEKIMNFKTSPDLELHFFNNYQDEYIKTDIFDLGGTSNFIIEISEIPGCLDPSKIPESIPKSEYKTLTSKKEIEINGIKYFLDDYASKGIKLAKICLIFSDEGLEPLKVLCRDVKTFFCFNKKALNYILHYFDSLPLNVSSLEIIFYIEDNNFIEYKDFYNSQVKLNDKNKNYLLPNFNDSSNSQPIDNFQCQNFSCSESLLFSKKHGFVYQSVKHDKPFISVNYYDGPCLDFLGTGCAVPSKFRNVSSVLYYNKESAILFDTGEDTIAQILRLHGNYDILKRLKVIFLSHSHADHILGLASILKFVKNKIWIIGPPFIQKYLEFFNIFEDQENSKKINFISTAEAKILEDKFYNSGTNDVTPSLFEKYILNLRIDHFDIKICGCKHSYDSTSISVCDRGSNTSFSYSGDTVPSLLFSYISKGANVMIHEATFHDDQESFAQNTNHSTKTHLTHFSNRNSYEEKEDTDVCDFYRHVFNNN